jgi:hypothetical protein
MSDELKAESFPGFGMLYPSEPGAPVGFDFSPVIKIYRLCF